MTFCFANCNFSLVSMEKYVASDTSELLLLSRSNSDEYLQTLLMLNLNQEIADQDITFIMLSHIAEIEAISLSITYC